MTVAVMVEGDSMFPRYMERETIYYRRADATGDPAGLIGREVVVRLGRRPHLRQGAAPRLQPGYFTLDSYNAPPMEDVVVEWVVPVKWSPAGLIEAPIPGPSAGADRPGQDARPRGRRFRCCSEEKDGNSGWTRGLARPLAVHNSGDCGSHASSARPESADHRSSSDPSRSSACGRRAAGARAPGPGRRASPQR